MSDLRNAVLDVLKRYEGVFSNESKFKGEVSFVYARALMAELHDELDNFDDYESQDNVLDNV
jgi:hypothetical protein